jgi:DNA polymerase-1
MFDDFSIPDFPHTLVSDYQKVDDLFLSKIGNGKLLSFDFETTGLHFKRDKAAGIAIANEEHAWYLHDSAMHAIKPWLVDRFKDNSVEWAAHNAVFDMHFSRKDFGVLPAKIADTQTAQWLLDENDSLALKEIAKYKLGVNYNLPSYKDLLKYTKELRGFKRVDQVSIFDIPTDILGTYAAYDSWLTITLWKKLKSELKSESLYNLYKTKIIPFTYVLLDMEDNGAFIDHDKVNKLKEDYQKIADDLLNKWYEKAGDVNPNSPIQLREYLYGKLKLKTTRKTKKTKEPSTDALTLLRIKRQDKSGSVELLLEYKEYEKLISTYLNTLLSKTIDGYIYTNFNQTGTVTGRLSSSGDINLQNIPSRTETGKELRACFVPPPGRAMIVADYSQIELRILAHYTRDKNLVKVFYWGEDPHQLTANKMGVPRYVGKTLNFGIIYGAQARTIADQIEKTKKPRPKESVAKKWLYDFEHKVYPSIPRWKSAIINSSLREGYTETIGGRRRRVSNLDHWHDYTRGRAQRQLINSKIQGSAGDVINESMLLVAKRSEEFGIKLHIQVHDELVLSCPTENLAQSMEFVQNTMESVEQIFNISVPIVAKPATGANWRECK